MMRTRRAGALLMVVATLLVVVPTAAETQQQGAGGRGTEGGAGQVADQVIVKQGRIESDQPDWVYVPFEVPAGVTELSVSYRYNRIPGNALDIGIFDPDGYELGNAEGFRGWSGGFRSEFTISRSGATPGYVPGDIEPGEWNLILGPYQVALPGLEWTATITLRSGTLGSGTPEPRFRPEPAPRRAPAGDRGLDWYRGDLHLHTVHSDGTYTPEQLVAGADAGGLDFVVSTEHNTNTANLIWGRHARPDLLVISGEEVTTRGGHYNAIGTAPRQWVDWRYRPEDGQLPRFLDEIHDAGGVAIANHPFCPFKGCDWRFGYEGMDAIEVWNGPWTRDDEASLAVWAQQLREGRTIAMAGGASDAHTPTNVIGLPQTVVRARALSRNAIIDGIAAGSSYVAASSGQSVEMTASAEGRTAGLGERLDAGPDVPVTVSLRVRGAAGTAVDLWTDDALVARVPVPDDDEVVTYTTRARDSRFARAEVRRPDGTMVALTNPVWLGQR